MNMLAEGETAPEFGLPDQNGKFWKLSEFKGQWVLLYFYPKDDTPGCVKEAQAFRDRMDQFKRAGINVLGISADDVAAHHRFAIKFKLHYPLLSDPVKDTIKAYGARNALGGIKRISYLIDPEGRVATAYSRVRPDWHAGEILEDFEARQK